MKNCFLEEVNKTVKDIKSVMTDKCICFALLTDSKLSDYGDETRENIKAVDKEVGFSFVAHLGNITNGDNPEMITRYLMATELEQYKNSVSSKKVFVTQGFTDGYRDERFTGQLMMRIMTDEIWTEETSYIDRYENVKRKSGKPYYYVDIPEKKIRLIFLSSYRVYADLEHPITENAPKLLDVIKDDEEFLEKETYALAKARAERFLADNPYPKNFTIVRPVISFSERRLDVNMVSGHEILDALKEGRAVRLPLEAKNLTAGVDFAGNSGKLIANLLFKKECIGEAYTVSSAQGLTWGEVADIYTELLGVEFEWVPVSELYESFENKWIWTYDRAYDRKIDNSKILKATGLGKEDFTSIKEGIYVELKKLGAV